MDYGFTTAPAEFTAALEALDAPTEVKAAVTAAWAATAQTDPSYEVVAATGDLWTVVRIAAVRGE